VESKRKPLDIRHVRDTMEQIDRDIERRIYGGLSIQLIGPILWGIAPIIDANRVLKRLFEA
jgi:hypothetical protein